MICNNEARHNISWSTQCTTHLSCIPKCVHLTIINGRNPLVHRHRLNRGSAKFGCKTKLKKKFKTQTKSDNQNTRKKRKEKKLTNVFGIFELNKVTTL